MVADICGVVCAVHGIGDSEGGFAYLPLTSASNSSRALPIVLKYSSSERDVWMPICPCVKRGLNSVECLLNFDCLVSPSIVASKTEFKGFMAKQTATEWILGEVRYRNEYQAHVYARLKKRYMPAWKSNTTIKLFSCGQEKLFSVSRSEAPSSIKTSFPSKLFTNDGIRCRTRN